MTGQRFDPRQHRRRTRLAVLPLRDEIAEGDLPLGLDSGLVPILAVLAAAADAGDREHAAHLAPLQLRHGEARRHRDVEAAVAIEQRRVISVPLEALLVGEEYRNVS